MSRLRAAAGLTALVTGLWAGPELLWAQTGNPPTIVSVGFSTTPCTAPTPWVYGIDDCAVEEQTLHVCMQVRDLDFNASEGQGQAEIVLITMESMWEQFIDQGIGYGPQPPPVPTDRTGDYNESNTNSDFYTAFAPLVGTIADVDLPFFVPAFSGRNQAHLRGMINYDVLWLVRFTVRNEQATQNVFPDEAFLEVCAVENPNLAPGNPPPFADAGGDQLVSVGNTVKLDASRSFDRSNVGFSPFDPKVYDKDQLSYTWEWMDGPERVDPEPDPDALPDLAPGQWPITVVTLEVANTDAKPYYIYRVTVDDGVNSPPSTAEVRIRVIPKVRENRAPTALIADANGQIVSSRTVSVRIGDQISLSAQLSSDPDGDPLTYHWRQTNELGGILMPDEVLREFQPLSGITDRDISWMAVNVGTFYFNLLVTDRPPEGLYPLSASATVTIDVSEAAAAGEVTGRASEFAPAPASGDEQQSAAGGQPTLPAVCGSGSLLSLALTPLGLWLVRGRRR